MDTAGHYRYAYVRRALAAWLWVSLLLLGAPSASQSEPLSAERTRALQPAIAQLVTSSGVGTGFVVRADGVLITALHVITGAPAAWAHFPSGKVCRVEGLVAAYPEHDLAVLKLREEDLPSPLPLIPLKTDRPPPAASSLTALGYPGGKALTVAQGVVLEANGHDDIQVYAAIRPGYSGGPLLNGAGEAVGVVTGGLRGEKLGFAAGLTELTAVPRPVTKLTTLDDYNRREDNSPEQLYIRAARLLHFWTDSDDDTSAVRSATEWALRQYNEARAKRPNFEAAHFNAGCCYRVLGKRPEAFAALKRTLELTPDNLAARLVLADMYLETHQLAEAEAAVLAVLAQSPSLAPAHRRLAACYRLRKQWEPAEAELRAALRDDPTDPRSLLDLGRLLATTGRREAALSEYRKVKSLEPEEPETLLALGKAYVEVKQYREAVEAHAAVVRLRPRFAEAHYALAVASLGLGDQDQARRAYETLERLKSPLLHKLEALLK